MAVDAKRKLIAADDVTNEVTDINQLANMALEAKANLEFKQTEVVADAGYYNASEVSRCVEQNIQPFDPQGGYQRWNTAQGLYGVKANLSSLRTKMFTCVRREES